MSLIGTLKLKIPVLKISHTVSSDENRPTESFVLNYLIDFGEPDSSARLPRVQFDEKLW